MPQAHRHTDSRFCNATTIVSGQSSVYVNNKLWAVEGDQDTHTDGALIAAYAPMNTYIENKLIIVAPGDSANPDYNDPRHPTPLSRPKTGSTNTYAYAGGAGGNA